MIFNYLKIAYRNLLRRKAFAGINIIGLSMGIACCILLFGVVKFELSFDKFQENYSRIYRVVTIGEATEERSTSGTPLPGVEMFRLRFPDCTVAGIYGAFGSQITVIGSDSTLLSSGKKFIEPNGVFFAEPTVFKIFTAKFLSGSGDKLGEPGNVILSQSQAEKYFGDWKNAFGKFLRIDLNTVLSVAGVIEDVPINSDFPFKVLASYKTLLANPAKYSVNMDWGSNNSNAQIYMLLPSASRAGQVNKELKAISKEVHPNRNSRSSVVHILQPLSELHFDKQLGSYSEHTISKPTIWTLILIGVMIIIMACINFVNLATAQSISRSKEVGLRKVLGGSRGQLMSQFLGEAAIIVVLAVGLGAVIATLLQPMLDEYVNIGHAISLFNGEMLIFLVILSFVVIILSGFYPALVLSGFKPVLALKSKINNASIGKISLRRGLVVLQFALSQLLIIGTIVAISQMNFIRDADLGLKKDAVLMLRHNADSASISRLPAFKEELLRLKGVEAVSFSSDAPTSDANWSVNFAFDGKNDQDFELYIKAADEDYFKTYGIEMIAGKPFMKSDTITEMVVNETLLRKLGVKEPDKAIGKTIRVGSLTPVPISGVVKDFNTNSLKENVKPLALFSRNTFYSLVGVKLTGENFNALVSTIQSTWDKFYPEYVNTPTFLDESIAQFYRQEDNLSRLYKVFSLLAIIISCLGLYGLISFMVLQKTKEVGVRKVLGASTSSIVYLFSKEFIVLILLAFVIASPLAWIFMNKWLDNFVFRINLGPGIFLFAILLTIVIAWITVGYKAIKAAMMNPVTSLRAE
jgi:putative ABC transport system permease protein